MNTGGLILVVGSLLAAAAAFIWLVYKLGAVNKKGTASLGGELTKQAQTDVEHIFDEDFRQELRNRGRLHFEKIIGENAMFLQQDLRQTTSSLNQYMRDEITKTLQSEFKKYEQQIADAKQMAIDSIAKSSASVEQQRQMMEQQLYAEIQAEKARIIDSFEKEMTTIINHYVLKAIGNQIDLTDQLDYILAELEANKAAIAEDVKRGT